MKKNKKTLYEQVRIGDQVVLSAFDTDQIIIDKVINTSNPEYPDFPVQLEKLSFDFPNFFQILEIWTSHENQRIKINAGW